MSTAVLREVRLYGALGREFGRVFRLAVGTPAEAVRALCAVLPGFEKAFLGRDGRQAYHVFVGRGGLRRDLAEAELAEPIGQTDPIRIVPVVAGSKKGGVLQTILGVVLVAVGAYFGNTPLIQLGVGLIVGGVIQLISPQNKGKDAKGDSNLPSYVFDGPINNTEQGGPVPVCYGRALVGSVVVSQGITTEDYVIPPVTPPGSNLSKLPDYEPPDPNTDRSNLP